MFHSDVVPSPDSGQPAAQPGLTTVAAVTEPPSARYTTGAAGPVTWSVGCGPLGEAGAIEAWLIVAETLSDGVEVAAAGEAAAVVTVPAPELELAAEQAAVSAVSAISAISAAARAAVLAVQWLARAVARAVGRGAGRRTRSSEVVKRIEATQ